VLVSAVTLTASKHATSRSERICMGGQYVHGWAVRICKAQTFSRVCLGREGNTTWGRRVAKFSSARSARRSRHQWPRRAPPGRPWEKDGRGGTANARLARGGAHGVPSVLSICSRKAAAPSSHGAGARHPIDSCCRSCLFGACGCRWGVRALALLLHLLGVSILCTIGRLNL
jgi:hypothetical protein